MIAALEREGIATARYLPSIHLQPYMRERYGFREGLCPVSEDLAQRTLALPFFTAIEAEDQERVAEALDGRAGLGEALVAWRAARARGDGDARHVLAAPAGAALQRRRRPATSSAASAARSSCSTTRSRSPAIALAAVAGGPRLLVWVAIALCAAHRGPRRRRPGRPGRALDQRDPCARRRRSRSR